MTDYIAQVYTAAHECHASTGAFPISFVAFPTPQSRELEKTSLMSSIVPGAAYSFDRYTAYLQAYRTAYLGITHRKAGWDALRHCEIIANDCVPLMPDVEQIPAHSMTFYPKELMKQVAEVLQNRDVRPSDELLQAFALVSNEVLNTDFLSAYILQLSSVHDASRILFVDKSLASTPDYLSLMTLIGLKRRLGKGCAVHTPVRYVYDDGPEPVLPLYGRGFGYFRALPSDLRSEIEISPASPDFAKTLREPWDVIIVGNIVRNFDVAKRIDQMAPKTPTVWIDGEDDPPSRRLLRFYSRARSTVFVREWSRPSAKRLH